jgi:hypothetical protein
MLTKNIQQTLHLRLFKGDLILNIVVMMDLAGGKQYSARHRFCQRRSKVEGI